MAWELIGIEALPGNFGTGYLPNGVSISTDGLHLFYAEDYADLIYHYTLSVPFDLSTASAANDMVQAVASITTDLAISPDGTHLYIADTSNQRIHQYNLSAAYDLATATLAGSFLHSRNDGGAITLSHDGLRMFVCDRDNSTIYEYITASAYDFTGTVVAGQSAHVAVGYIAGVAWSDDGMRLWFNHSSTTDRLYQFNLSAAYDLATATQNGSWLTPLTSPRGLHVDNVSGQIFICNNTDDTITRYQLGGDGGPAPVVEPEPIKMVPSIGLKFLLTLTGAANATTDVLLPMTNINARLRSGSDSYLMVTVPYTSEYSSQIAARPNGDLQISYVDSAGVHAVVDTAFETVQPSRAVGVGSIVMTGHRQSTNAAPASHDNVKALSLQSGTNSKTAICPGYDPTIKPGDTVTVEGETYVLDVVGLQASVSTKSIQIQSQLIGG